MVIYDDVADDKIAIYDGIDRKAVLGENMDFDAPKGHFSYRVVRHCVTAVKFIEPLRVRRALRECIRISDAPHRHCARTPCGGDP